MRENNCEKCGADIDQFGRILPKKSPDGYINPALASDVAVVKKIGNELEILLIRRGEEPSKGLLAFPGGRLQ